MKLSNINWRQLGLNAGVPLVILIALAFMPNYGWDYGVTLFSLFLVYMILAVSWAMLPALPVIFHWRRRHFMGLVSTPRQYFIPLLEPFYLYLLLY